MNGRDDSRSHAAAESGLFAGVADLPSINDLLEEKSRNILARFGIRGWTHFGGQEGSDGRLTLGPNCSAGRKLLRKTLTSHAGFIWESDETTWAVRLALESESSLDAGHLYAHAVCYRDGARLLDAKARERAAAIVRNRLAEYKRPGRMWTAEDRHRYAELTRFARRLRRADEAERCLQYLREILWVLDADLFVNGSVLGEHLWQKDYKKWPDNWYTAAAEFLTNAYDYQFGIIHLDPNGWAPRVVTQSAAVTRIRPCEGASFRLDIAEMFGEVLATFANAARWKPADRSKNSKTLTSREAILKGV